VRLTVDEEPQGKVGRRLRFQYVGAPLRRFRLADVGKGQRIPAERARKHPERQPHEVLLDRGDARLAHRIELGLRRRTGRCAGAPHAGRRRRHGEYRELNQFLTIESGRCRPAFLGRNLVLPYVLVRKFDRDLEFNRDEIVPAHLLCTAGGHEVLDRRQPLLAAQRFPRLRQDRGRILCGRLGREKRHRRRQNGRCGSNYEQLSENAHTRAPPKAG
jgi:hypothetical protein